MSEAVSIGMIGDYDPDSTVHRSVMAALGHSADYLSIRLSIGWLPTESLLEADHLKELERFAGLWAAPGSPYRSPDGALMGIRFARETNRPFLGT